MNFAIASVTTPITNAFNAIGRIKLTTKLMLMWTALTWIFYPLLSLRYGYLGTAAAALAQKRFGGVQQYALEFLDAWGRGSR